MNKEPLFLYFDTVKKIAKGIDKVNEKAFNKMKNTLELTTNQYNNLVKQNIEIQFELNKLTKALEEIKAVVNKRRSYSRTAEAVHEICESALKEDKMKGEKK